ncbi:metallophosphoesterase family protein [Macrococcus equipercicus]|uniref:Serine/threonine protein phosphatase n=1 Tax=Macrococcus equipercicus TaxID=69967 RepID=A0A9Q9F129_9STAP|nr:metallophosphoesterase family protein [Macrococcus equipercicus]KAA1036585.1 serine/threonine protein phosphatase [Macrococcus equipercicus]UTH13482.1 serine/threonine protein phosphatase [Macrococcus equipercicus]
MNYYIIGDVHGCYHTLKKILKHWHPSQEQLLFVGDYINKGQHSRQVVALIRKLQRQYPDTVCLKGNHEYEMVKYIESHTPLQEMKDNYRNTLKDYDLLHRYQDDVNWMKNLPLFYENKAIYVSHAGVNFLGVRKFKEDSWWSVLRFRGKLKRMKQLQVIGHTPTLTGRPEYTEKFHSLNIDSGAGNFTALSAVLISADGRLLRTFTEKVEQDDHR